MALDHKQGELVARSQLKSCGRQTRSVDQQSLQVGRGKQADPDGIAGGVPQIRILPSLGIVKPFKVAPWSTG
jgi:hypothetical protein